MQPGLLALQSGAAVTDVLLPRTDAEVAVQFLILVAAVMMALVLTRRSPTGRLLVVGVGLFTAALMTLRAVH